MNQILNQRAAVVPAGPLPFAPAIFFDGVDDCVAPSRAGCGFKQINAEYKRLIDSFFLAINEINRYLEQNKPQY
ncbi:hypothetical protein LBM2029_20780 (plasmid) [Ralstonia solanacearum]|nr:hypothetical protein LBM2029_20780 [Ralstonia solanacearum]